MIMLFTALHESGIGGGFNRSLQHIRTKRTSPRKLTTSAERAHRGRRPYAYSRRAVGLRALAALKSDAAAEKSEDQLSRDF
jgi:hypothetical protein